MCGNEPFPEVKNIVITGQLSATTQTISKTIALPFAPRLMEVTSVVHAAVWDEMEVAALVHLSSTIVPEILATLPIIPPISKDKTCGIKVNLNPGSQVQGLHQFTFSTMSGNWPPTLVLSVSINLEFTR